MYIMEQELRLRSARTSSKAPASRIGLTTPAARPITQQGLGGARPIQTGIGKINRMYKDKKYYISTIHSHMNSIRDETTTLLKNTAYNRATSINRPEARTTAEVSAKNYTELQELLSTFNAVLELHASQEGSDKLIYETSVLKEKNKATLAELDALVNTKLQRDDRINMLKKALAEEDFKMQNLVDNFSDQDKIKYMETVSNNEQLVVEIKEAQVAVRNYKDSINKYQNSITSSKARQQQLLVSQELDGVKLQRDGLLEQLGETLTASQQKEILIQQIKNCKLDTESLLKVKASVSQELQEKKGKLQLLENELNEKNGSRLKKHKELRDRGEQMSKFIASFGETSGSLRDKLDLLQNQILQALNHLTDSTIDLNFEELDNLQSNLNQSSVESLSCQHDLMTSRFERLSAFKKHYQSETDGLKKKQALLQTEIETYHNSENEAQKLENELESTKDKCKTLRSTLNTTSDIVNEAQRREANLKEQLKANELYHAVHNVEIQLDAVEKEITNLHTSLNNVVVSEQATQKLQNILILTSQINEQLIASIKTERTKNNEIEIDESGKELWQDGSIQL